MTAEEQLAATLGGAADLVALVANRRGLVDQVPGGVQDKTISWLRVSTVALADLTTGGDLDDVRMQVDAWAAKASDAKRIAKLARDTLAPKDALGIGRFVGEEGPFLDPDIRLFRVRTDYFIWEERS